MRLVIVCGLLVLAATAARAQDDLYVMSRSTNVIQAIKGAVETATGSVLEEPEAKNIHGNLFVYALAIPTGVTNKVPEAVLKRLMTAKWAWRTADKARAVDRAEVRIDR